MYKFLSVLILFSTIHSQLYPQILPKEGSKLHYRIIGFSFPEIKNSTDHILEIAKGNYNTEDSFKKNILFTMHTKNNRVVSEVPSFSTPYTWRVVYQINKSILTKGALNHFSTNHIQIIDSDNTRLRIIKKTVKYKDAYVFLDGTKTLYDMNGKPVWSLPDIGGIGTPPRDLKLSPQKTITFLLDKNAYEINYNADILWKGPNNGMISGDRGEGYHHEFTRLENGHYMVLGKKTVLWELPSSIDSSVLKAPGEIIIQDSINKKYYQKMELGTVIEYDNAGNIIWSWSPSEYLKGSDLYYRRTQEGLFDLDVHENSFYFDEKAKTVYVSFRDVSRIVKIKYPEGKILNSYGGIYKQGFREVENSLFCYQHSCKRSQDGYLYLYDNNGCHLNEHPKIIMMKEPGSPKDSLPTVHADLKKIWEYDCNVRGMDEKSPIDSVFISGGNVVELPDHSMFVSMCVLYGNVFIVSPDKRILWNAIIETWNPGEQKWKVNANYRASIIINRKQLEGLIWNEE